GHQAMLGGQFFCGGDALGAGGADDHDVGAVRLSGGKLDFWNVVRDDDGGLAPDSARRLSAPLRVIATGVGNDSATALGFTQRSDFVVGAAQFERADRLETFGFEVEFAIGDGIAQQRGAHGDAANPGLRLPDVVEGYEASYKLQAASSKQVISQQSSVGGKATRSFDAGFPRQRQGFGRGTYRVVGAVQKEYLRPSPSQMPAGRDALHLRGVQLNGSHQWGLQLVHFVAEKSFQCLPAGAADAIFLSTRGIVLLPQPEADGVAGAGEILRRTQIFNVV